MIIINTPPHTDRFAFYANYLQMYDLELTQGNTEVFVRADTGVALDKAQRRTAVELAQRCGIDFTEVQ